MKEDPFGWGTKLVPGVEALETGSPSMECSRCEDHVTRAVARPSTDDLFCEHCWRHQDFNRRLMDEPESFYPEGSFAQVMVRHWSEVLREGFEQLCADIAYFKRLRGLRAVWRANHRRLRCRT